MPNTTTDKRGQEVELFCERPHLANFDGIPMSPNNFALRGWEETLAYKPRDDDIFIVTYPKSGTTWLQEIFFITFHARQPKDFAELSLTCPFLEWNGISDIETMHRPGTIKVHTDFNKTPYSPKAKYILCVRNPKDVCTSFYYHEIQFIKDFEDCPFQEFFEYFMDGKVECGNYFNHLESWYPMANNNNVLLLTYEDMKDDLRRELRRIGDFIGGEYGEKLKGDFAEKVIELSSLKNMKERFSTEDFGKDFIRKGVVNDWQTHFSKEMNQRLEGETYRRLEKVCPGLLRKWEGYGALSGNV